MEKQTVIFRDLGIMEYQAAWDYQEKLLKENVKIKSEEFNGTKNENELSNGEINMDKSTSNYLLFVEHPAVYTLGKSGNKENILLNDHELEEKNIQFFNTNRGGDITFHGPDQLVGYPILDLENFYTDIGRYLRSLEEVIILTLEEYGIKGERSSGETGVWIDTAIAGRERKICAIGVRCSRWITMHGFAFNINTELSYFNHIIPCGINNKQVTSLEKELGYKADEKEVKEIVKRKFEKVFNVQLVSEILL